MSSLREQLNELEKELAKDQIAISPYHDLPFAIFRYEPSIELQLRKEIQLLKTRLENTGKKVHIISLSELFWESINNEGGIKSLIDEEKEFGFAKAQESLNTILSDPDYTPISFLLEDRLNKIDPNNAIVFLTRASVFAPNAFKISALLDHMKGKTEIPCILFYPGTLKDNILYFMDLFDQPPGSYHVNIYNR